MDGFFYDYEENAPGTKVKTQKEMHDAVLLSLNCEDSFAEQRKLVSDRFHTYQDGHSSNRIIESILR